MLLGSFGLQEAWSYRGPTGGDHGRWQRTPQTEGSSKSGPFSRRVTVGGRSFDSCGGLLVPYDGQAIGEARWRIGSQPLVEKAI